MSSSSLSLENIEVELAELEELISLQRRKVDLLKSKNAALWSTDSVLESKSDSDNRKSDSKSESNERKSEKQEKHVSNPIGSVVDTESDVKELELTETPASSPQTLYERIFGKSVVTRMTMVMNTTTNKEDKFIDSMTRLQRLTTDLANERNLLAWGRTALAAARTTLAFLAVWHIFI
jgi:hypothetical protein